MQWTNVVDLTAFAVFQNTVCIISLWNVFISGHRLFLKFQVFRWFLPSSILCAKFNSTFSFSLSRSLIDSMLINYKFNRTPNRSMVQIMSQYLLFCCSFYSNRIDFQAHGCLNTFVSTIAYFLLLCFALLCLRSFARCHWSYTRKYFNMYQIQFTSWIKRTQKSQHTLYIRSTLHVEICNCNYRMLS